MTSIATLPPVADGLLRISPADGAVALLAGRHRDSGRLVFPLPDDVAWEAEELPRRGTLWSFTVQRFRPKSPPYAGPAEFEPYAVGYVDFGALIVEGRLAGASLDAFRIGMPMRVVPLEFLMGDPPRAVLTYAFAPDAEGAAP